MAQGALKKDAARPLLSPELVLHNGTLDGIPLRATVAGYDLGDDPVTIDVAAHGRHLGLVVVHPTAGRPVSLDARLGAVVAADHLALGLTALEVPSNG